MTFYIRYASYSILLYFINCFAPQFRDGPAGPSVETGCIPVILSDGSTEYVHVNELIVLAHPVSKRHRAFFGRNISQFSEICQEHYTFHAIRGNPLQQDSRFIYSRLLDARALVIVPDVGSVKYIREKRAFKLGAYNSVYFDETKHLLRDACYILAFITNQQVQIPIIGIYEIRQSIKSNFFKEYADPVLCKVNDTNQRPFSIIMDIAELNFRTAAEMQAAALLDIPRAPSTQSVMLDHSIPSKVQLLNFANMFKLYVNLDRLEQCPAYQEHVNTALTAYARLVDLAYTMIDQNYSDLNVEHFSRILLKIKLIAESNQDSQYPNWVSLWPIAEVMMQLTTGLCAVEAWNLKCIFDCHVFNRCIFMQFNITDQIAKLMTGLNNILALDKSICYQQIIESTNSQMPMWIAPLIPHPV